MSKEYEKAYHRMVKAHIKKTSKIVDQIDKLFDEKGEIPEQNTAVLEDLTDQLEQNGKYYNEQSAIYKKAKAENEK